MVAGNPDGPTSCTSKNIKDYTVQNLSEDAEPDALYWNIRENMNDGKTDTWFRYAALVSDSLYFDYYGKVDTDTLVFTTKLFSFMSTWPAFPNNVRTYGGRYIVWGSHALAYGHTYMAGHLYWMSPDLVRYIGFSERLNREALRTEMEDMTTGSYVNMMPQMIRQIEMDESVAAHGKLMKRPRRLQLAYVAYLNKTRQSAS